MEVTPRVVLHVPSKSVCQPETYLEMAEEGDVSIASTDICGLGCVCFEESDRRNAFCFSLPTYLTGLSSDPPLKA